MTLFFHGQRMIDHAVCRQRSLLDVLVAAPIDDTGWFTRSIAQLKTVVSTFHFYGNHNLTADLCQGESSLLQTT